MTIDNLRLELSDYTAVEDLYLKNLQRKLFNPCRASNCDRIDLDLCKYSSSSQRISVRQVKLDYIKRYFAVYIVKEEWPSIL